MLKTYLLLLGRGAALLAAVYLPTFVSVSALFATGLFGVRDPEDAGGLLAVLVIAISFAVALILIVVVAARSPNGFRAFGFSSTNTRYLWWALGLGLAFAIALRLIESVLPAGEAATLFNLGRLRTPTKADTDSDENGHLGVRGRERTRVDEVSALSGHGTRIGASFRYSS